MRRKSTARKIPGKSAQNERTVEWLSLSGLMQTTRNIAALVSGARTG
jgi:hypothetical protein